MSAKAPAKNCPQAGNGFTRVFEQELDSALTTVHREKLAAEVKAILAGLAVFLIAFAIFQAMPWLFQNKPDSQAKNWFAITLFALVFGVLVWWRTRKFLVPRALAVFRERIVRPIARHVDPAMEYASDRRVSPELFEKSLLFDNTGDGYARYAGDGLFSGHSGGVEFEFSPLRASWTAQHGCRICRGLLFEGLYLTLRGENAIDGYVLAWPKTAGREYDALMEQLAVKGQRKPKEVIAPGNPDFNRTFSVFASDTATADRIMVPPLTQRLLELRDDCGVVPFFSRVGDRVSLALFTGRWPFSPPEGNRRLDLAKCIEFCNDIRLCVDLAKDPSITSSL